MEDGIHWLRELLELGEHYLDVVILLACSAFGMLLTLALEWWFLPTVQDPAAIRRQRGLTFLFCWTMSALSSSFVWWAVDPADPLKVRLSVSIVVGAFGFFAYPALAKFASDKMPSIGSAWDGLRGNK